MDQQKTCFKPILVIHSPFPYFSPFLGGKTKRENKIYIFIPKLSNIESLTFVHLNEMEDNSARS